MAIGDLPIFSMMKQRLHWLTERQQVLAENVANANTPGYIAKDLKENGHGNPRIEGVPVCDWVLIDTGDVIVHVFRPEVRAFYNLEKMWSSGRPNELLPS